MRNKLLDVNKGIAITLVVIGHTIQSTNPAFDQNLIFRVIYSFHMPYFMLLSGASASYWLKNLVKSDPRKIEIKQVLRRLARSAATLLIPFFAWTAFSYFYHQNSEGFKGFTLNVTKNVELSLWFLPVLFWCNAILLGGFLLNSYIAKLIPQGKTHRLFLDKLDTQIIVCLMIWLLIRPTMPDYFGIGMANYFHGGLFLFFAFGILIQNHLEVIVQLKFMITSSVIFLILIQYWSRTDPNSINSNAPRFLHHALVGIGITVLIGLSGSISTLIFVNYIGNRIPNLGTQIPKILGENTLGIYAIHLYFLSFKPQYVLSIASALTMSLVLSKIPVIKSVFFGKFPLGIRN